jgi:cytidylate kinase
VQRRLAELQAQGVVVDGETLRGQVLERDRLDASRPVAPLRPASDAIEIDSSDLTVDDVVERIVALTPGLSPHR